MGAARKVAKSEDVRLLAANFRAAPMMFVCLFVCLFVCFTRSLAGSFDGLRW